jgi:hypothetical protein
VPDAVPDGKMVLIKRLINNLSLQGMIDFESTKFTFFRLMPFFSICISQKEKPDFFSEQACHSTYPEA